MTETTAEIDESIKAFSHLAPRHSWKTVPEMIAAILKAEESEHVAELARRDAEIERLRASLEQIANRDDAEMKHAATLHYDMQGIARAALAARDASGGEAK